MNVFPNKLHKNNECPKNKKLEIQSHLYNSSSYLFQNTLKYTRMLIKKCDEVEYFNSLEKQTQMLEKKTNSTVPIRKNEKHNLIISK